jgi:hypothetical protein
MKRLICALFSVLAVSGAAAEQAKPLDENLRYNFNLYTWLTAHNAFDTSHEMFPNQSMTMTQQLDYGVRGLMLDLWEVGEKKSVRLCHGGTCLGEVFATELNKTILPFLRANKNAVITLHLEDYTSRQALANALAQVPDLAQFTFKPDSWPSSESQDWPTLEEIIASGQRLLIFTLNNGNSGDFPVGGGVAHVMRSDQGTVENYWSLGDTIFTHDRSCKTRWGSVPLDTKSVAWSGKKWARLFTMNHFHGAAFRSHSASDNAFNDLSSRVQDFCAPAAKRNPNYLALDHVDQGDGKAFSEAFSP